LLILDEATSALDPLTEFEMARTLRERGCTCLVVAHRLSSVRDADRIIVMERGAIVEQGSFDELRLGGRFAELARG
jgi:ABC-type multidrug transport system fused ATPase/permease subunit